MAAPAMRMSTAARASSAFLRRWELVCLAGALLLGGIQILRWSVVCRADSLAYLSMAWQLRHGDLTPLAHPYWSQLYPLLIAAVETVVPTNLTNETRALTIVNSIAYVFAALCFWILYRTFYARSIRRLPPGQARAAVFFLFTTFWYCHQALDAKLGGQDVLVAGFTMLQATLAYRLAVARRGAWRLAVLLGLALAAGYFAKAPMFVQGFLLLGVCGLAVFRRRPQLKALVVAALVFAAGSAPLVAAISRHAGHLTFGESGRLNYAWLVNGVPQHAGWIGGYGAGAPLHGPRVLETSPETLEFDGPVPGTYPLWYDPSYWHAGLRTTFSLRNQLAALGHSVFSVSDAVSLLAFFLAGLASLALLRRSRWRLSRLRAAVLLVWPAAIVAMYLCVVMEHRYVIACILLLLVELFWIASRHVHGATWSAVAVAVAIGVLIDPAKTDARLLVSPSADIASQLAAQQHRAAAGLTALGLVPGGKIAMIGYAFDFYAARLDGLRIVSQVLDDDAFWSLPAPRRETILQKLRSTGVAAVVSFKTPSPDAAGWRNLPGSRYYAYVF